MQNEALAKPPTSRKLPTLKEAKAVLKRTRAQFTVPIKPLADELPSINRISPRGMWEVGTVNAQLWFRPDGKASAYRGSRSLEADWRSVAGRYTLDLTIENGARLHPIIFDLVRACWQRMDPGVSVSWQRRSPSREDPPFDPEVDQWSEANAIEATNIDPVTYKRVMHQATQPDKGERNMSFDLPNFLAAYLEALVEPNTRERKGKHAELYQLAEMASAILFERSVHERFMEELVKLATNLGRPPLKGELRKALAIKSAATFSHQCHALCFKWLPTKFGEIVPPPGFMQSA
jgi:hypothetical protein